MPTGEEFLILVTSDGSLVKYGVGSGAFGSPMSASLALAPTDPVLVYVDPSGNLIQLDPLRFRILGKLF